MADWIELVLLTKSHKDQNYCVAGIDRYTGQWIRLVSARDGNCGALPWEYIVGMDVLEIVRVPIIGSCPARYQRENVLINERLPLQKIGDMTLQDVMRLHPPEQHDELLGNGYSYVTAEKIADVGHSLEMVEVRNLRLYPSNSKNKNRASFTCNGRSYDGMSVTDPCYYSARNETIVHALLVLSLPNRPFKSDGNYYKFIAKIFPI